MNNRKYYEANDHECSLIRWRVRVRQAVAARGALDRDFQGAGAIDRAAPPPPPPKKDRYTFLGIPFQSLCVNGIRLNFTAITTYIYLCAMWQDSIGWPVNVTYELFNERTLC